ncbi:MAG: hypothetical protein FD149_299 [Rhodospirillaceae bacterium]|nr:MAG: hypothetical protein FD149_299 [Rhodospirillaceae bacterium]
MRRDCPVQHPGRHDPGSHIRAAFSRLAPSYERMAVLERAAGERLLEMLAVGPQDSVLDLGCGPGHLTRRLRTRTKGKLVGIDLSAGMIAQARWRTQRTGITFLVGGAEDLDFDGTFNIIFCNSALQWFTGPGRAVDGCYRALRRGGWLGVQVPATRQWCSLVRDVMTVAAQDPRTSEDFRRFRDPVFFMATAEEYVSLFNRSGFEVHDA